MENFKFLRSYQTLRYFLLLFIPLLVIITVVTWYVALAERENRQKLFFQQEKVCVENHHQRIVDKLKVIKSDLEFISRLDEFRIIGLTFEESKRLSLEQHFLSFSTSRKQYDQIRFIDLQGMERIRVNYKNGSASIVPPDQLQSKAKRYYFTESLKLDRGEIYVSPFDLNIEQGKLEKPFNPTIRFATPVFDEQDNRTGFIVLNLIGQHILDILKEDKECDHGCQIMLINSEGFWLRGVAPEMLWGFMLKDGKEKSFANHFPNEWQKITTNDGEGQFISENGFFSFTTICPLNAHEVSSDAHSEPTNKSPIPIKGENYHWKLVSKIPLEVLAIPNFFLFRLGGAYLTITLALACITFLLALSQIRRKEAETSLKNIFNTSIPICITDVDYQIVMSNDSYRNVVGESEHNNIPLKCYESRPGPSCQTDKCPMKRVLNGEKKVVCEPTKEKADGSKQYFIVTARPFLSNKGELVGIVECFQDITDRKNIEMERDKLIKKLQKALEEVKTLQGILPICSFCKNIRNDEGYYEQIEGYIHKRSDVDFSHTICPTCAKKHYPDIYSRVTRK